MGRNIYKVWAATMDAGKEGLSSVIKLFPCVAAFIDWSTEHKKTPPLTRVQTNYSEIVADVMGDMGQWAWSNKGIMNLEGRVKVLKRVLIETFDERCDSELYTLKYHVLDHMLEGIQNFGTLSFLESILYEHLNVHTKQVYRITSQRTQTRMTETVNVVNRNYERVLSYGKEEVGETSGRNDERKANVSRSGAYLLHNGISITMD